MGRNQAGEAQPGDADAADGVGAMEGNNDRTSGAQREPHEAERCERTSERMMATAASVV